MANWSHITALYQQEFKREFSNLQGLGSVLLYVFCSTFIAYISFKSIDNIDVWNGIFWLMVLFASINSTSHTFKEGLAEENYLRSLCHPNELLISKILFNASILLIANLLCLGSYSLFLGSYIAEVNSFLMACIVGTLSITVILTTTAAISKRAAGNSSLFAVLGLPILLPILLLVISGSKNALGDPNRYSFLNAEIFSNETQLVKAVCISTKGMTAHFSDAVENIRELETNATTFIPEEQYLLELRFNDSSNQYELISTQLDIKQNPIDFWVKLGTVLLVSILLFLVSLMIFPKFWVN